MTKINSITPLTVAAFLLALTVPVATAQKESFSPPKKDNSVYAELAKAPKKAAARRNPLEGDPDAVAAGAKLFELHCAECHGETAGGSRKAPSLLADPVQQATPGTLFWILTNGVVRRGMPVWSKLPEAQRWQIVRYLKSLSPAGKASLVPLCGGPSVAGQFALFYARQSDEANDTRTIFENQPGSPRGDDRGH
jgi:mono/diheme cytochrome c family protein